MRAILLLGCVALAACDRQAEILEKEYAQAVTPDDQCRVATKIADAYLKRSDAAKYKSWALTRDTNCLLARTVREMM